MVRVPPGIAIVAAEIWRVPGCAARYRSIRCWSVPVALRAVFACAACRAACAGAADAVPASPRAGARAPIIAAMNLVMPFQFASPREPRFLSAFAARCLDDSQLMVIVGISPKVGAGQSPELLICWLGRSGKGFRGCAVHDFRGMDSCVPHIVPSFWQIMFARNRIVIE
jgi:hypothetical protein